MDLSPLTAAGWTSSAGAAFLIIALAELGDKSQLVCMTLAARHRGLPVVAGAVGAFALLNLLAVLFGAAAASWLPPWFISALTAALFATFGVLALRHEPEEDEGETAVASGKGALASAFTLIFLAEFGDKTQLAVAGLSSAGETSAVWTGATLALGATSLIGVLAGRRLLKKLPLRWIHRASGVLFIIMAALAASHLIVQLTQ